VAKLESAVYQPGKRAMLKIKHVRSADCVVAGLRLYKDQADAVGSLLLGLYDDAGALQHVGVTSSFTLAARRALLQELQPLRRHALAGHPWRASIEANARAGPAGQSRWSRDKDLSWQPLRLERVCEVRYDHLQGRRFRHATTFMRWRPDKAPRDCRYDQLEVTTPYELARVFGA
jgi:ATP-dependent DNA ligase